MLLEVFEYATKFINNVNTTSTLISTTTTATTTTINESKVPRTTITLQPRSQLQSPLASITTFDLNSVINVRHIKSIFKKTLLKMAKSNFSDYAAQYSLAPHSSVEASSSVTSSTTSSTSSASTFYSNNSVAPALGDNLNKSLAADMLAITSTVLPATTSTAAVATRHLVNATNIIPTQTVATFIAGNKNRATTIIVYPTVSPESIVIPIVSCIFGFPILALIVICCLRRRAKLARERDRRRNYDMQDHAVSLVRFSPIHRLNYRSSRAISLRPERSLSQGFTSLELDTVMEERSDIEQTQTETLNAESPLESTSYKMSISS